MAWSGHEDRLTPGPVREQVPGGDRHRRSMSCGPRSPPRAFACVARERAREYRAAAAVGATTLPQRVPEARRDAAGFATAVACCARVRRVWSSVGRSQMDVDAVLPGKHESEDLIGKVLDN